MQIVIDIPEDVYTRLFDNGIQDNEIAVYDVCEMARAIRLGTPLPKGHGRLIDADTLALDDISFFSIKDYQKMVHKITIGVPTIIEADKENKE